MAVIHARHRELLEEPAAAAAFAVLFDSIDPDAFATGLDPVERTALRMVAVSAEALANLPAGEVRDRLHARLDAVLLPLRKHGINDVRLAAQAWLAASPRK
jgi:hypothetical protein